MSLSSPIWKSSLGPLLVRLPLGLYLFIAGYKKFLAPNEFIEAVKTFNVLPDHLAVLYGVILPYAEMLSGFLLFFGFLTTLAAAISSLVLLSVVIAVGVTPQDSPIFNKDILLLGASMSLLATGSGAVSIDDFRHPVAK
jgi:uncharacterized membrane protein YphA (DoxX/SURF4 family)